MKRGEVGSQDRWIRLLVDVSDALDTALTRLSRAAAKGRTDARFFSIFVLQAGQDIRAIASLYKQNLKEPAQILVRAVIECRLNFDLFFLRFLREPTDTMRLMLDAMMLEKMKQMESVNFRGLDLIPGAPTPDDLRQREREIKARRSPSEVKALRKHGFTQMTVEQRAREMHHSDMYNMVYRNFSRNVHGSDYAECLSRELELNTVPHAVYTMERDKVSFSTAAFCATGILDLTVRFFRFPMLQREFLLIALLLFAWWWAVSLVNAQPYGGKKEGRGYGHRWQGVLQAGWKANRSGNRIRQERRRRPVISRPATAINSSAMSFGVP